MPAIALLVLAGCSPRTGVAVGPTDTTGVPRAYVPRCENDAVTSVRGEDFTFFRLSDLRPWKVYWDGRQVSLESFRHDAYYGGKCAAEPIPIGFEYAALGLSVVTAATIIGLVLRRRRH